MALYFSRYLTLLTLRWLFYKADFFSHDSILLTSLSMLLTLLSLLSLWLEVVSGSAYGPLHRWTACGPYLRQCSAADVLVFPLCRRHSCSCSTPYTTNSSVITCMLWCLNVTTVHMIYASLCYWYFSHYSILFTFQSLLDTADISGNTLYRWHFGPLMYTADISSLLDIADFLVISMLLAFQPSLCTADILVITQ